MGFRRDGKVSLYGCDVDLSRAEELMAKFGGEGAFGDYREVLEREDIEVVDICLPHNLHREVAVEALRAGKHVLLEKPIADTGGAEEGRGAELGAGDDT